MRFLRPAPTAALLVLLLAAAGRSVADTPEGFLHAVPVQPHEESNP